MGTASVQVRMKFSGSNCCQYSLTPQWMNGNTSPFSNCHALRIGDVQSNGGVANADRSYLIPPYLGHMKHLFYKTVSGERHASTLGLQLPSGFSIQICSEYQFK